MKYVFICFYTLYLILRTKRNMHMLQQNFYNNSNRYVKWIFNNKNKAFVIYDLLFILITLVGSLMNQTILLLAILYFVLFIYYFKVLKKETTKIKFKITSRVKRMFITLAIIYSLMVYFSIDLKPIYVGIIFGSFITLNCFIVYLVYVINKTFL